MSMKLDSRQAAEAFKTLGQIALAAADYDLAVRHFERAIELMPHSSDALYSLGTALNRMGQSDRGKHYLERSQVLLELDERLDEVGNQLTNDVGNTALRVKAANILLEMGDKTKAANYMLSALRYDPDLHSAHEMLAEYYREQGRGDLARQHRELARSPDAAK
jgi:Tfp pilus assembly protein PilF